LYSEKLVRIFYNKISTNHSPPLILVLIPAITCSVYVRLHAFTFSCCVPLRRRTTRLKGLHFCVAFGVLGYQKR